MIKRIEPSAVQEVFHRYYNDVMLNATDIRSKTHAIKQYILNGINALVSNRNPHFYWGPDEKTKRKDKVNGINSVQQSGNQLIPANIPILPNLKKLVPYPIPKPIIIAERTCSFDSIYQIFAALYKDNKEIAKRIDASKQPFDEFIKDSFSAKKLHETVQKRNELFRKMFHKRVKPIRGISNVETMYMGMTSTEMLNALNKQSNFFYSAKEFAVCKKCKIKNEIKTHVTLPTFNYDWKLFVQNMQLCIEDYEWTMDECLCEKCKNKMELNVEYDSVILIDIEGQYPDYRNMYIIDEKEIPRTLEFKGKVYEFRGAVGYELDHGLAHVKRNNGHWQSYDGCKSTNVINTPSSFMSYLYVYGKFSYIFFF